VNTSTICVPVAPVAASVRDNSPGRSRSGMLIFSSDFVNSNPEAFVDAYWDIRSIRIYNQPSQNENQQPDVFPRGHEHEAHH
jgi:hypothetical protein